ncbi:MAG: glycosyltransferase family 9 protein [Arenicella sp.]|nr:glycosyltransferase family 9 protein [Arenicella sp.]
MKFLVIRFKLMGDAILATSLCHSLRLSFPDATIDYVTYTPYDQLLENHASIDNVLGIDKKTRNSPIKYLRFIRSVTKKNYDVVIDAQGTAKSNFFALLSREAKFKISSARKRLSFGYTHQLSKLASVDKLEERLHLLTPLKEHFEITTTRSFDLSLTDEEISKAKSKLIKLGIDFNRPLFAFAISANESYKKWCRLEPIELVNHCRNEYVAQIILFHGLPCERFDVELFSSKLESVDDVFHGFEIESIRCLPALFSLCDLFVGNEGGPRHIAQSVGTPSVAIFSPSADKQEWLPANDPLHQGFEWRDVTDHHFDEDIEFEIGDSEYYRRYNSIKADMIKPLIKNVLANSNVNTAEPLS